MVVVREPSHQGHLVPTLGLFTTVMLIAGSMIGSGIFRLPASMMFLVQNPTALIMLWIVGALFTICGALTFAELAGMFPAAGGQYVFLREGMGRRWAFLYGWTFFWIVQTGIIAGVAIVFAEFLQVLWGFDGVWIPAIAVGCIATLSIVNYFGVKFGGAVNNVFTVSKIVALALLVILGFLLGNPSHDTFNQSIAGSPTGMALFTAFFSAMLLGLFALDGWPQAAYVAPEVKEPKRNVPRAMILGVLGVATLYVLATLVYLYLVSAPDMILVGDGKGATGDPGPIAATAAKAFWGSWGAKAIAAAVVVSTFGTVNAYILTSPRIYYAVAKDGLFPRAFSTIHPRTNAPTTAILIQGTWAGLLVCLGRFSLDAYTALVAGVVFCLWLSYIPTIIGYFRLRFQRPDLPRPYRTTFYPVVPIVFFAAALLVVGNELYVSGRDFGDMLVHASWNSKRLAKLAGLWGVVTVLVGVFVMFLMKARWNGQKEDASSRGAAVGK